MFVWQLPKHILFASVALEGFIDSWHTLSMAFMQAVQTNEVARHVFFIQVQTKQSTSMKAREAGHLRHLNTFKIFTRLPNPNAMHLWDAGSLYFQCACSVANQRGGHVQRPAWAVKRTLWPVMRHHTHSPIVCHSQRSQYFLKFKGHENNKSDNSQGTLIANQSKQMSSPFWSVLNCRLRLLQARRADGSTNCWPMHSHHLHRVGLVPEQRVQIPSKLHLALTNFVCFPDSKGFAAQSQPHLWVSKGWSIQPPTKERRRWGGVRVFTYFLFWSGSRQNSFWLRPIDLCVYTILLLIEHHFCLSGVNLEPLRHALLLLPTDQMSEPETRFKQCSEAIISICKPWNDKDFVGTNMEQHQRGPTAMITVSSRYGHHRVSFRLISTHFDSSAFASVPCCPLEAAAFAVCNLSNFWATAAVPLWVSCQALSYHKSMPCKLNWHSYIILHPNLNLKHVCKHWRSEDFPGLPVGTCAKIRIIAHADEMRWELYLLLGKFLSMIQRMQGSDCFPHGLQPEAKNLRFVEELSELQISSDFSLNCGRALNELVLLCWHDRVW